MKIALFGGAFNPITLAHIQISNELIKICDEVWIIPCYQSKYNKKLELFVHRYEMCKISTKNKNVKISDIEYMYKFNGSSINLINKIKQLYTKHDFYFVIGLDNANRIHTWTDYKKLIKLIPFIVISRGDIKIKNKWFLTKPHLFLELKIFNYSSTDYRNNNNNKILDKNVLKYIKKINLY